MRVIVSNVVKIGQTVVEILRFYGFPKWRPPSSWIFKHSNSYRDQICVNVLNFIKIGRSVAEICRFSIFQDGGRPPSCIDKIAILNKECQCASSCQILSKSFKRLRRYRDLAVFQNGARHHLEFSKFQILTGSYA